MTLSGSFSPLTVTIVGCGVIGTTHAEALTGSDEFEIVAVVDAIAESAVALARRIVDEFGRPEPRAYTSLSEALSGEQCDIVVICTPSGLHVSLADEALAAGVHVVIEKPLDVTMPRARRLAELADGAESRGQVVSVISQHRFDPASVVVAEAAHDGRFGRVTSAVASVAWWRSQEYYDSGQWRGSWELDGGGAVMNQGVHTVDLLVWFLGTPREVFAHTARLAHERVDIEDVAVATVRFDSGALAVLHATTAAYPGVSVRIQVHGDRGSAVIDDDQLEFFHVSTDGSGSAAGATRAAGGDNQAATIVDAADLRGGARPADAFRRGHARQYADIAAAIRDGRRPGVRVQDALLSLAVVRAVYLSATLHRAVDVSEVLSGALDDVVVETEGQS